MPTVYFDGHCNLCNSSIDILIRHDRKRRLRFASLQGETARARLPAALSENFTSMVFENDDGRIYIESDAAIRAGAALGGGYKLLGILLLVPGIIRNLIYRFIAKRRYDWFGRRDTCRLPNPEERAQFLP